MTSYQYIDRAVDLKLAKYYLETIDRETVEIGQTSSFIIEVPSGYRVLKIYEVRPGALNPAGVDKDFTFSFNVKQGGIEQTDIPWVHCNVDDPIPLGAKLTSGSALTVEIKNQTNDDQTFDMSFTGALFKEDKDFEKYLELVKEGEL